jgi:hypothetical protein
MKLRTTILGLLAAGGLAGAASAAAQPQASPLPPSHTVEGVTVIAPLVKQAPEMVRSFAAPRPGHRLARWRSELCPYVRGLSKAHDAFIETRLAQIASAAGIPVTGKRCDANLLVLFTTDPDKLTDGLGRRRRLELDGYSRWPIDKLELANFTRADDRPIRLFRVRDFAPNLTGGDGSPIDVASADTQGFSFTNGVLGPPTIRQVLASRLTPATDAALTRVVAVVDSRRMVGFTPVQIAAYVAMSTLAEVNPEPPADGVPTIVTLPDDARAGRTPPPDLTFWDRAYLGALYKAPSQENANMQESLMATRIRHAAEQQIRVEAPTEPEATPAATPSQAAPTQP